MNLTIKISETPAVPVESLASKKIELGLAIINRTALCNCELHDIASALGLPYQGITIPSLTDLREDSINTLQSKLALVDVLCRQAKDFLAKQYQEKGGEK